MIGRMFLVAAAALLAGCAPQLKQEADVHTWPMSAEQLDALKKMPRAERDAWFAKMERPTYEAHRRVGEIRIDGVLDEPAWKRAQVITLREGALGGKVHYATRVRMLWDDDAIYVAFECDDPDIHAPLAGHDENLWQHDVVELFVDPDGDGKSYMELHVAPSGGTADLLWADFRPETDWFSSPTWTRFTEKESATAYNAPGVTAAVKVRGTLNVPTDTDEGYTVEWRIPYSDLVNVVPDEQKGRKLINVALFRQVPIEVPKAGTVWRMNFNRCDDSIKLKEKDRKGNPVDVPEYSAWAPTTGSFHMPFLFGTVKFVK
jgi:hypothetical protein